MELICITNKEMEKPLTEDAIIECIEEIARHGGGYMIIRIKADKLGIKDREVVHINIDIDEIIEDIYRNHRGEKEWIKPVRAWVTKKTLEEMGVDSEKFNILYNALKNYEEMIMGANQ